MANNTKHIHEIEPELASSEIDGTEFLVVSNPNGTGYDTNKVSIDSIAEFARDGANSNGLTMEQIFNQIYPIGSIYTTIDKRFNPGTAFGGTWSVIGDGRCLFGCNQNSNKVGTEIPSALPTLSVSGGTLQLENLTETGRPASTGAANGAGTRNGTLSIYGDIYATRRDGTSVSMGEDVKPPSIGVIFWKRTA